MAEMLLGMDLLLLEPAEEELRQAATRRGQSSGEGSEPEVEGRRIFNRLVAGITRTALSVKESTEK